MLIVNSHLLEQQVTPQESITTTTEGLLHLLLTPQEMETLHDRYNV